MENCGLNISSACRAIPSPKDGSQKLSLKLYATNEVDLLCRPPLILVQIYPLRYKTLFSSTFLPFFFFSPSGGSPMLDQ